MIVEFDLAFSLLGLLLRVHTKKLIFLFFNQNILELMGKKIFTIYAQFFLI